MLVEEREKESGNGGSRGREGGEGRKGSLKCSPGIAKAQLGKKGVCVSVCVYMCVYTHIHLYDAHSSCIENLIG